MDIKSNYTSYINQSITQINNEQAKQMDEKKLKEASQGLEAEFMKIMLKQIKNSIFKDDNKSTKAPGKNIMTDFMLERFAEDMAKNSSIGLADMIVKDVQSKNKLNK